MKKLIPSVSLVAISIVLFSAFTGCGKGNTTDEESVAPAGPTVGTAMSFSNVTSSAMDVTWGQASSTVDAAAALQYKLVYSASNNVGSSGAAETNGTVALDWTANTLTSPVTGLSDSTTYYFAVLVKDSNNNVSIDAASHASLCTGKVLFLTSVPDANMGGAAGADAICNANKPSGLGGSTFKAMLSDAGSREACTSVAAGDCSSTGVTTGRVGWMFANSGTLCTSDYTGKIGTTSASGYPLITTGGVLTAVSTPVLTGMNIYMGTAASNNCSDWSSTSGSAVAGFANGVSTDHSFWANGIGYFPQCSSAGSIYCVEQ